MTDAPAAIARLKAYVDARDAADPAKGNDIAFAVKKPNDPRPAILTLSDLRAALGEIERLQAEIETFIFEGMHDYE